jgi:hypothetical protein
MSRPLRGVATHTPINRGAVRAICPAPDWAHHAAADKGPLAHRLKTMSNLAEHAPEFQSYTKAPPSGVPDRRLKTFGCYLAIGFDADTGSWWCFDLGAKMNDANKIELWTADHLDKAVSPTP